MTDLEKDESFKKLENHNRWLKETYENRRLVGIIKDRLLSRLKYVFRSSGSIQSNESNSFNYSSVSSQAPGSETLSLYELEKRIISEVDPLQIPEAVFDTQFYLETNSDVKDAGVDPLDHYISTGWKEGRDPNKVFSTLFYLDANLDVLNLLTNPLVHYISFGKFEKRAYQKSPNVKGGNRDGSPPIQAKLVLKEMLPFFYNQTTNASTRKLDFEVDIILPVYNGMEYLKVLLPQIFSNTDMAFRLFIVNDCSPDQAILPFLKSYAAKYPAVILLDNPINIGFTHSVNRALRETTNHVVLLNSDTEVPEKWLSRLVYPLAINPKVSSCTPFSNCATICSFPTIGDNNLFDDLTVTELDKAFQKGKPNFFEIPTGIGFCMALSRRAIERIGLLDEVRFEKGYGEEVDWCQRARKEGFENVVVQNLFVYHKHGGSFSSEAKNKLVAAHNATIDRLYPLFHTDVMECIANSVHNGIRETFLLFTCQASARKTLLYLDHDLGGGANLYMDEVIALQRKENMVLVVKYNHPLSNPEKEYTLRLYYKEHMAAFKLLSLDDLGDLMKYIQVDELIISEVVSYPDPLKQLKIILELKKQHRFLLKFLLHDYFAVCPNFTLMYKNKSFCNVPEMSGCEECIRVMNHHPVLFPSDYTLLPAWRKAWLSFFEQTDSVICFTPSAKAILVKAYPTLKQAIIEIIPHKAIVTKKITIGILGNILAEFKGALIVNEIAKELDRQQLDFIKLCVIGTLAPEFNHPRIQVLGVYNKEDLTDIIQQNKVDLMFIPSIWPETFSYTTQEAILSGLPVCSFDLGGQADQLKVYEQGHIMKETASHYLIQQFINIVSKKRAQSVPAAGKSISAAVSPK